MDATDDPAIAVNPPYITLCARCGVPVDPPIMTLGHVTQYCDGCVGVVTEGWADENGKDWPLPSGGG